jgi:nucleotide-binding universal stress UspA family protein
MNARDVQGRDCVVVGLDDVDQPSGLLLAAADAAEQRQTELAVVAVVRPAHAPGLSLSGLRSEQDRAQALALQQLHAAAVAIRPGRPHLVVSTYCLNENEVSPNRQPLLWANLLVIGTRTRSGRQELVQEPLTRLLLLNSRCPVLIVPDDVAPAPLVPHDEPPLVLAGISGHPADQAVVTASYAEARGCGGDVLLLQACPPAPGADPDQERRAAEALLTEYARQAPPGTRVATAVTTEHPAIALRRLAGEATLLVIGARTGTDSGLITESVSRQVLESVPGRVLAVPRHLTAGPAGPLLGLSGTAAEKQPGAVRPRG